MKIQNTDKHIVLVGAGIMSATLGTLIKKLIPDAAITIYERLDKSGTESSSAWNNAGTGHSAFCELNYTPRKSDGKVDLTKALAISEQFEVSKQFWAFSKGAIRCYGAVSDICRHALLRKQRRDSSVDTTHDE